MRPFAVIAAILLASSAVPAAASADSRPASTTPLVRHWRAAAHHRVRHAMRHRRSSRWPARVAPLPQVPVYFAWAIPSPLNPGYDRAMVLLLRSPAVSGIYTDDPGYPTIPVVAGGAPYQRQMGCCIFEYDSTTGEYVQLSQADAAQMPPPPPPSGVPIPLPMP